MTQAAPPVCGRHFHLDPVGGLAGDMFVAAVLDLRPALAAAAIAAVRAAGIDAQVTLAHTPHTDGTLSGSRFEVAREGDDGGAPLQAAHDHDHDHDHNHVHHHDHDHEHPHAHPHGADTGHRPHLHWSTIRTRLAGAALPAGVRTRALDIFARLAAAEAEVHGVNVDEVTFHEVGAWDSIADIVAAASVIEGLGTASWSVGALPLGSGRVDTAHGLLPVPAPATAILLRGRLCFDDGRPGERVTPTGAAILAHLAPAPGPGATPRRLAGSGNGFGQRRFAGLSNVLRILEFDTPEAAAMRVDEVVELAFDIDDQTAEELALGLDRLRATSGVIDVVQFPIAGKRGRLATAVRVLAAPAVADDVAAACFAQTTTLGLRLARVERRLLPRSERRSAQGIRVKTVARAGRRTAKAEIADVESLPSHAERSAQRAAAVTEVLRDDDG